ncbi:MAG: cytochrome c biogenesis protein ResB [Chitinispirillaceae bacterium]|nr:cytochrome c biogenesis protein ResB [Chitinispirillaceae bacterium]
MRLPPLVKIILKSLGSLRLTVVSLIFLSILVVWGTLYQVDHGIYSAQERFFNAWIILIGGFVPFPAVRTLVALLSVNLLAAAFKKRPVTLSTAGIFIMHIGVALLVGGAVVASTFVQESAVTLAEGQQATQTYDFSLWKFAVVVNGVKNGRPCTKTFRYDLGHLRDGKQLRIPPAGVQLSIDKVYTNCGATLSPSGNGTVTALSPVATSTERGRNVPGIVFSLRKGDCPTGTPHYVYAGSGHRLPVICGSDTVTVWLHPVTLALPLKMELQKFSVEWHPGTRKPKRFETRLRLFGPNIDREVVVEMNRPYRYRSFTFYQMGYNEQNGRYVSTLAVVKNPLRYLPYIASMVIVAGCFLYFLVKMIRHLSLLRETTRE